MVPDHEPVTSAQIAADLDELERHIDRVRRDVARFHHEGERHFIDQASREADPGLEASRQRLKFLDKQWHASSRQVAQHDPSTPAALNAQDRLRELQQHIEQVRRDVAQFHHEGERHFGD